MRIFEKLFRPSKLESLGDGLNAVKAKMDVVGKNLAAKKAIVYIVRLAEI